MDSKGNLAGMTFVSKSDQNEIYEFGEAWAFHDMIEY